MEQDLEPYTLDQAFWNPVEPPALSPKAVKTIADALVNAAEPLIITGYSGRNHAAVGELVKLADTVPGLRVLDTGGSDMCFPAKYVRKKKPCFLCPSNKYQPPSLARPTLWRRREHQDG